MPYREEHHAQSCMQIGEEGRGGVGRRCARRRIREGGGRDEGGGARKAGALRKICSLKISICKCDTADVPSTALHGLAKLGPARLGSRSDLGFAFRALFTFAPPALPPSRRKRVRRVSPGVLLMIRKCRAKRG